MDEKEISDEQVQDGFKIIRTVLFSIFSFLLPLQLGLNAGSSILIALLANLFFIRIGVEV